MHPDRMIPQMDDVNQDVVDEMERNLRDCPFCGRKSFFEDTAHGWYVASACGARVPGDSAYEAATRWNTRVTAPVARVRPTAPTGRAHWTGW